MPIRKRIDNGLTPECRRALYVFQFLYDQISWGGVDGKAANGGGTRIIGGHCTIGDCYDNEVAFVSGFQEITPGLKQTFDAAKERLRKFVKQLVDDNWIEKGRIYNDKQYIGEMRSGWYPTYKLYDEDAVRIRMGIRTCEEMARRYAGCD